MEFNERDNLNVKTYCFAYSDYLGFVINSWEICVMYLYLEKNKSNNNNNNVNVL